MVASLTALLLLLLVLGGGLEGPSDGGVRNVALPCEGSAFLGADIRGPRAADTNLMQAFPGWISKGGAEALFCAGSPDGLSLALKVEDGTQRGLRPALGAFLGQLGFDGAAFGPTPVGNSRNEVVGEVRVA